MNDDFGCKQRETNHEERDFFQSKMKIKRMRHIIWMKLFGIFAYILLLSIEKLCSKIFNERLQN